MNEKAYDIQRAIRGRLGILPRGYRGCRDENLENYLQTRYESRTAPTVVIAGITFPASELMVLNERRFLMAIGRATRKRGKRVA
jgi:hypothetical protein